MMPWTRALALVVAGAFAALLLAWALGDEPESVPSTAAVQPESISDDMAALHRQLEQLQAELRAEAKARERVEADLGRLRQELAAVGGVTGDRGEPGRGSASIDREPPQAASPPSGGGSPALSPVDVNPDPSAVESERPMFDVGRLVAAGVHPRDAEELGEAWQQFSLDRLYLVDQAAREGWLYKPRFQREVAGLEHGMLEDVGEDGWDRLLYGSGQPNRVIVRQVLEGSSADIAGLQPGDVIMRYNDRRVFKMEWLQAATARGRPGAIVQLEVFRAGEPIVVDVERGPLGTLLRNAQVPPPVP